MTTPVVHAPGEGTAIWHIDTLKTFKALTEETGGRLTAWEELLPQWSSPPLHVHSAEDEAWFVLDGALTFQVAKTTWTAEAGAFVWAPAACRTRSGLIPRPPGCWASPFRPGSTGSCPPPAARPRPRVSRHLLTGRRTSQRSRPSPESTEWRSSAHPSCEPGPPRRGQ